MARTNGIRGSVYKRKRQGANAGEAGAVYYIRYRGQDGRDVRRCVGPDRRMAELALAHAISQVTQETHLGIRAIADVTFAELSKLAKPTLKGHQGARTMHRDRARHKYIGEYFGDRVVTEITPSDVQQFVGWLRTERTLANGTICRYLSVLSVLYRFAIDAGYARRNPVSEVKRPKESAPEILLLDLADFDRLLGGLRPSLQPVALVAWEAGLRRGEIARLQWRDVVESDEGTEVIVRHSKSGHPRRVPCLPRLRALFDTLREHRAPLALHGPSPVFPEYYPADPTDMADKRVERITWQFAPVARRLQFDGLRFHDLRHNFAVGCIEAGVPITDIGRLLGHAPGSIATTMRYARHGRTRCEAKAIYKLAVSRGQIQVPESAVKP